MNSAIFIQKVKRLGEKNSEMNETAG